MSAQIVALKPRKSTRRSMPVRRPNANLRTREYLLKRCAARLGIVAQSRKHGSDDVFHFLPAHSIACRYGDMGFSTRSSRA
jgi:hypothetical protein